MNSSAIVYADIFDYPLTESELKLWQISGQEPSLKVIKTKGFWHLPGRQNLVILRRQRQRFSQLKWQKLKSLQWVFTLIPWISLVAVTGALSMNNADQDDDLDLMIITAKNRLWLTRLLLVVLLFSFLRRHKKINNRLCLNLFLDETCLLIKSQNLYTAHEICQAKPLFERDNMYQQFIFTNKWVSRFLPNWIPDSRTLPNRNSRLPAEKGSPAGEGRVLNGLLDKINSLSFHFQYSYMKPKITREQVGKHFAFFHPRPTGEIILTKYQQRISKDSPLHSEGESLLDKSKTILVTGCFDVLHAEHKKFLRAAKNLGGKLLIGVETDTRVRQLKGPGRPINSLKTRLKNLRQLKIADQVFALPKQFNRPEDYKKFIVKIKPDILAVSASTPFLWNKRQLMASIGGEVVVVLPHNPKISTTKMLKSTHAK